MNKPTAKYEAVDADGQVIGVVDLPIKYSKHLWMNAIFNKIKKAFPIQTVNIPKDGMSQTFVSEGEFTTKITLRSDVRFDSPVVLKLLLKETI